MKNKINLVIPGRPVPAVRMTQRGKFVKPQAQRYLAYKENVAWMGREVFKSPFTGPVEVNMRFYLSGKRLPDIDNMIKAVLDGLNGIAWHDDRQVVKVTGERVDHVLERTEVEIAARMAAERGLV